MPYRDSPGGFCRRLLKNPLGRPLVCDRSLARFLRDRWLLATVVACTLLSKLPTYNSVFRQLFRTSELANWWASPPPQMQIWSLGHRSVEQDCSTPPYSSRRQEVGTLHLPSQHLGIAHVRWNNVDRCLDYCWHHRGLHNSRTQSPLHDPLPPGCGKVGIISEHSLALACICGFRSPTLLEGRKTSGGENF